MCQRFIFRTYWLLNVKNISTTGCIANKAVSARLRAHAAPKLQGNSNGK